MLDETLKSKLKKSRKEKNLSQEQVADYLNVKRQTYGAYETGVSTPDAVTLSKLALLFDVSTDYLLCNTDDPTPPGARKTLNLDTLDLSSLSEESKKDLLKHMELLKMRDNVRALNDAEIIKDLRLKLIH